MLAVSTCFQSVMLYLTPGMSMLKAGLRVGCGCRAYGVDPTSQPPLTSRQLRLDKLSGHTSQHWVPGQSLGHQQMCFIAPIGDATINSEFMHD